MKTIRKLLKKHTRRTNTTRRLCLEHLDQRVVLSAAPLAGILPAAKCDTVDGYEDSAAPLAGALPADPAPIGPPQSGIPATGQSSFAYGTLKYGVNGQPGNVPTQLGSLTGPGPGAVFGPQVRGGNNDRAANDGPMPQSLKHDVSVHNSVVAPGTPAAFSPDSNMGFKIVIPDSNMGFKIVYTDPPKNQAMQHNATDLTITKVTAIPDVLPADSAVPLSMPYPYTPPDQTHLMGSIPTQLGNLSGPGPGPVYGPQLRGSGEYAKAVDQVFTEDRISSFFDVFTDLTTDRMTGGDGPMPQTRATASHVEMIGEMHTIFHCHTFPHALD